MVLNLFQGLNDFQGHNLSGDLKFLKELNWKSGDESGSEASEDIEENNEFWKCFDEDILEEKRSTTNTQIMSNSNNK